MMEPAPSKHSVISVLTDNEPGVVARIAGLFSGRGYNIHSLTVAPIDHSRARFTIRTGAPEQIHDQIVAQLNRLVPVHEARHLPAFGEFVTRELVLLRLRAEDMDELSLGEISGVESLHTIRTQSGQVVLQFTGTSDQIDGLLSQMRSDIDVEVVRTGPAAISTGDLSLRASSHDGANTCPPIL